MRGNVVVGNLPYLQGIESVMMLDEMRVLLNFLPNIPPSQR